MPEINSNLIADLEKIEDPQELIGHLYRTFGNRCAIGTSGQLTGTVMIDQAIQAGITKPRVFTIDTLRLFPETYQLFDALEAKYGIHIERLQPDTQKIAAMVKEHGEFLFFDSKEKQELCCNLRKVEPNDRVLESLDVWITGLRTDQSKARAGKSRFEIITHNNRSILKVAPLLHWSEKQTRDYCAMHQVPIHKLLNWNQDGWYYESLGCVICTTPIGPTEPRRAGRWRWFKDDANKECGLHVVKKDE